MFTHAITRLPGRGRGTRSTAAGTDPPDFDLLLEQHAAYVEALRSAGLEVLVLDALEEFPDAHFVEDAAVILREMAVLTRLGASARRGEEDALARILSRFRTVERIGAPGTLDGSDVLAVDGHFFIGISERTNLEGAMELTRILETCGHAWGLVSVEKGLHLKSSVNHLGGRTLLVSPEYADHEAFRSYERIVVDPEERGACNILWVNDFLFMHPGFPRTRARLGRLGLPILEVDVSEARKMGGGLTCMSLRF
ncbi:MAG: dimethylarginine dimethylaminohydrolase family protein [Planctomycetota bacterium]